MTSEPRPPMRTRGLRPFQLVPNLLTLAAICAGLTSMRMAFDGNVALAMALIVLAAVLDGLDGPAARLLKSESAIGAELDSLADFVNFGVAPGLLLYLWVLEGGRSVGWIAVLIYAICCALRLARFNVSKKEEPAGPKVTFTGVPAPGGALLVLLPLVVSQIWPGADTAWLPFLTGAWLFAVGMMMISRMPTPSFRMIRVSREHAPYLLVGAVALLAASFTWPWPLLLLVELGYLAALLRFALRPAKSNVTPEG